MENSLIPSEQSIKLYRMLRAIQNSERGNEILKCYFAYHGDYVNCSKVRNEQLSDNELSCIRYGIYHHIKFAYWAKDNLPFDKEISIYVSVKLIMNNDLSYVDNDVHCIWYPEVSSEETCCQLIHIYPELMYQVARVCTIANYTKLFDKLDVLPDYALMESANKHKSNLIYYKLYNLCKIKGTWFVMNDSCGMIGKPVPINPIKDDTVYHRKDIRYMYKLFKNEIGVSNMDNVEINENDIGIKFQDGDPLNTLIPSVDYVEIKMSMIEQYLKS